MPVTIERVGDDEESVKALFEFILPMSREVALAPVDIQNALANCYRTIADGSTFRAVENGEIVGSLGLARNAYWYGNGEEFFLIDRWLYVRPDKRFGDVGIKLLRAGRDEGTRLLKSVFIMVANPDRRPKQNEAAIYATVAGYTPIAHLLKLYQAPVAGVA
jgi:hypothetical protein